MLRKKVYNNRVMLTLLVLLITIFILLSTFHMVYANESSNYEKTFKTVLIEQGDTLTSIALDNSHINKDFDEYISEVKAINNLKNDTIHQGCYLIVPVYQEIE